MQDVEIGSDQTTYFKSSKDGQIRSVIIQLLNKQLVSRAINHLFPLEIQATQSEDIKNEAEVTINESGASGSSGNLQNFHL